MNHPMFQTSTPNGGWSTDQTLGVDTVPFDQQSMWI